MKIGIKIRELRKKRGMTQEQLAEHLNISAQAVSKWENQTAYPDINLIPAIASVFEVSTDNLFGINDNIENERTRELRDAYEELCRKGDNVGRKAIMREALEEYPHNHDFMIRLARSLFRAWENKEELNEAISLCRTVIQNSKDETLRCSAIQTAVRSYAVLGDREMALEYASMLPPLKLSREYALEWALSGEDRNACIQDNALELLIDVSSKLTARAGAGAGSRAFLNDTLTLEQELYIYNAVERLLTSIFPDDNCGVIHGKLAQLHRFAARAYAKSGDSDNAMAQLLLSEKYADSFESGKNNGIKYTSPFFDRLTFTFTAPRHGDSSEHGRILRKLRQWDCFDFMRDDPRFIEYEGRIENKARQNG